MQDEFKVLTRDGVWHRTTLETAGSSHAQHRTEGGMVLPNTSIINVKQVSRHAG